MSYYDSSLKTRNVVIVCVTLIVIAAVIFVTSMVMYRRNQAQEEHYRVACVTAGKSLVHGDCVKLAGDQ